VLVGRGPRRGVQSGNGSPLPYKIWKQ
jgi:hypothetical protein